LNLSSEPVGVDSSGEIWRKDLDDDLPLEIDLVREEYARHPRAAQLSIDAVSAAQNSLELR
jgi:hypothetical protein